MKQTKIFVALSFCFLTTQSWAAVSSDLVAQSASAIKAACGSTIDYSLNRPFDLKEQLVFGGGDVVKDEYHETMNCIWNNSMAGMINGVNEKMEEEHKKYQSAEPYEPSKQKANSHCTKTIPKPSSESRCGDAENYSACVTSERMMAEWCGYNMYLWGKLQQSERLTLRKPGEAVDPSVNTSDIQNKREQLIFEEKAKAEEAAFQARDLYNQVAGSYETNGAQASVNQHLKGFNEKLTLFRIALSTWSHKFINAQAKFCKQ